MVEEGIDIHAHILPQVDDGAADWDDSSWLMDEAAAQGFRHIIATPHFSRHAQLSQLKEKIARLDMMGKSGKSERPPVRFSLGQEILYFEDIAEYLDQGKALTLAGSRYVLVEFLPDNPYSLILRGVRRLLENGYLPVAAHVERYPCLYEKGRLEELIHCGGYIQVNCSSLAGSPLNPVTRWCRRQLLEGRVHFLATDMHRRDYRPPRTKEAQQWIEKKGGPQLLHRLLVSNPRHILQDRVLKQL